MPPSDTDLMTRICHRDADAFEALASRYRDAVLRHIAGIVHNSAIAQDVLQEVLMRLWMRADQWDGTGCPRAWLFRIATNLALNEIRTASRRRETGLDEVTAPATGKSASRIPDPLIQLGPDCQIEAGEQSSRLRRLIGALPAAKRDVAQLAWEEELELHEVAERLDIPEGTVKSRLYHARKWLACQWNAEENEQEDKP